LELIAIVVTVCAQRLEFSSQFSLKQCVMSAQPYLAQWIGEHPKWTIKSYHCEYPHSKEKADAPGVSRQT
jgi:hypothetical protein